MDMDQFFFVIHCIECEDVIDMKLNEVYGIASGSVTTTNDIKTMPNEVYGIAVVSGDHSTGVSGCCNERTCKIINELATYNYYA
jgi:hypothetical protein